MVLILHFIHHDINALNNMVLNLLQQVVSQFEQTSPMEWFAFSFGVAQVVLALKNQVLNFYAGIISVGLYIYVFYFSGLYAESLLNIYYLIVSIAGIFLWQKKVDAHELPISRANAKDWKQASLLFVALFFCILIILRTYTNSNVPLADAIVTSLAWVGTWLMIHRKLENWLVLNVSNLIAIPLLIYKGLHLTAILTIIYVVIAIMGYNRWKKTILLNQP
jgi:nicotinamide mononucleotide transporter